MTSRSNPGKSIVWTICFLAASLCGFSQNSNHTISIKVDGVANQTVYLANYLGNKLYYNDTTTSDANGNIEFEGKPFDKGGKYAVVLPGPRYFDILIADEQIELETDTLDMVGNMEVKKSVNNKVFFDYIHFIKEKQQERMPLDAVLNDSTITGKKRKDAVKKFEKLNADVIAYQKNLVEEHKDKLVGKLMNMTMEVEIPEAPEDAEDERKWKYNYYKNHFWDNTDLSDPRLVRDQQYHNLLDKYINKVLPQVPDTICERATELVEKVRGNDDMFKYTIHFITYNGETSKIMCMDKVFVYMVNKYYKTGDVDWIEDEKLAQIIESAESKELTLCGEVIPNVILPDTTGQKWEALYDIDAEYTVVAIWEANCGHCKKEMPKLLDLYHEWKDKGVEVYAIGGEFENDDWKKFIRKKNLDWINVSDNPEINNSDSAAVLIRSGITTLPSLNFRSTFDVTSTPKIYLVDSEKKIIAKQLSTEQLNDLLKNLTNDEARKEEK